MNLKRLALHAAASYQWSQLRQEDSGRWRGDAAADCAAYYKAPWCFSAAGDPAAAANSLSCIQSHFLRPDGDLEPIDNQILVRRHPLYPHAHVALGAAQLGRVDVADHILGFLATHRHDRLAAWGDRGDTGELRSCGSVSTACVGLAFLERGNLDQAGNAVEFFIHLLTLQPNPEVEFFHSVAEDGRLLTEQSSCNSGRNLSVRFNKRFQTWWAMSFPLILLARFAARTDDISARQAAAHYLALLDRSPQAWTDLSAGKLSLACALMYRLSGDPKHKVRALRAARAVLSRIGADGGWHACHGGEGGSPELPTALGYEVNLEFALMMAWAGRCLAERDGAVFPVPAHLADPGALVRWMCRSERALLGFARRRHYRWHALRRR